MSWFSNLFRGKLKEEIVKIDNLESWFRDQTSCILNDKEKNASELFKVFESQVKEVEQAILKLEKAHLKNPNIEPRIKSFMRGNRENYVKQARLLLRELPEFGKGFPSKFKQALDQFSKRTNRNYQILQEFFADETNNIAKKIKELDASVKQSEQISRNKKILDVENTIQDIFHLSSNREWEKKIEEDLPKLKEKLKLLKKEFDQMQRKIVERKSSSQFKRWLSLKELVEKQREQLKDLEHEIVGFFSPLTRAFRKYKRISLDHEKLLDSYIDDPFEAFLKDLKFEIVQALLGLKASTAALGLKDKEKQKLEDCLNKITRDSLNKLHLRYTNLDNLIKKNEAHAKGMKIVDEIQELNNRSDEINTNIAHTNLEVGENQRKLEEIQTEIKHFKRIIIENIEKILKIKLTLS